MFEDKNAIVLISRSTEVAHCPSKHGVIRVDNYWCRSAFLSQAPPIGAPSVDSPGTRFVTVFCDDQKVLYCGADLRGIRV